MCPSRHSGSAAPTAASTSCVAAAEAQARAPPHGAAQLHENNGIASDDPTHELRLAASAEASDDVHAAVWLDLLAQLATTISKLSNSRPAGSTFASDLERTVGWLRDNPATHRHSVVVLTAAASAHSTEAAETLDAFHVAALANNVSAVLDLAPPEACTLQALARTCVPKKPTRKRRASRSDSVPSGGSSSTPSTRRKSPTLTTALTQLEANQLAAEVSKYTNEGLRIRWTKIAALDVFRGRTPGELANKFSSMVRSVTWYASGASGDSCSTKSAG